jgi:hypothetical protein
VGTNRVPVRQSQPGTNPRCRAPPRGRSPIPIRRRRGRGALQTQRRPREPPRQPRKNAFSLLPSRSRK